MSRAVTSRRRNEKWDPEDFLSRERLSRSEAAWTSGQGSWGLTPHVSMSSKKMASMENGHEGKQGKTGIRNRQDE